MSDTLPEREDQIANEEADERTFQRIRRARLIGNPNQNADWCDDCHGYTHMPWCPSYKEPDTRRSGEMGHRTNHEQPASEHQPAARGGGDEWRISTAFGDAEPERAVYEGGRYLFSAPLLSWFELNQIVTEHNQHQALMAERKSLILTIKNALDKVFNDGRQPDGWVQIQQSAIDELRTVVQSIEQRSTSE